MVPLGVMFVVVSILGCHVGRGEEVFTDVVIGAGAGGIQMGVYLEQAGVNYVVLEREDVVAPKYRWFPRSRKLLSINKRFTGSNDSEYNLRHDWNSLLDCGVRMEEFSKDFYPSADSFREYLEAVVERNGLKVRLEWEVEKVEKGEDGKWEIYRRGAEGVQIRADRILVATGLGKAVEIAGYSDVEGVDSYRSSPVDLDEYSDQFVAVIGGGNAAFETASRALQRASLVHVFIRGGNRLRLAWETMRSSDIRVEVALPLETYMLKSLDGVTSIRTDEKVVERDEDGRFWLVTDGKRCPGRCGVRKPYDRVVVAAGSKFDNAPFDKYTHYDVRDQYPRMTARFEAVKAPNLFFVGSLQHAGDVRTSNGGDVRGYRYLVRALHRQLQMDERGVWPDFPVLSTPELTRVLAKRITSSSALYNMHGHIADLAVSTGDGSWIYAEECPIALAPRLIRQLLYGESHEIAHQTVYAKRFASEYYFRQRTLEKARKNYRKARTRKGPFDPAIVEPLRDIYFHERKPDYLPRLLTDELQLDSLLSTHKNFTSKPTWIQLTFETHVNATLPGEDPFDPTRHRVPHSKPQRTYHLHPVLRHQRKDKTISQLHFHEHTLDEEPNHPDIQSPLSLFFEQFQ